MLDQVFGELRYEDGLGWWGETDTRVWWKSMYCRCIDT